MGRDKSKENLGGAYDNLGRGKENLGGTYDNLGREKGTEVNVEGLNKAMSYAERKEHQKRVNRAEKAVKESERKIEEMENRLKELDALLMVPENASDMKLVTEYTTTKRSLDEEVERWEKLSEELESISNQLVMSNI